jgi:ATP-dependent DNA ligase
MAASVRTDGFVEPCIPTRAARPPSGPDWVHEIKHDGYRLIVRRDDKAVHLFTRRGYDWTDRARDQRGRLMRQEPAGEWSAARR